MRARLGGDLDDAVVGGSIRQHPGRVVGGVDDDESRRGRDLGAQPVDIDRPAVALVELVERHVRAGRPADLVQALVGRPGDDRVVARSEQHVGEAEDRLLGAGEGQDVVGLDRLVQRGDLAPQQRMAGRLGVAQLEAVPQRAGLVVSEREQLRHRVRLDVRGAQQVLGRELPAGEVALEGELGDAHGPMMRHHAAHGSTDRHRRRPDRTRRPSVGDGALAGRVAGLGLVEMLRARPGSGRRRGARCRRCRDRPGFRPDPDPRAKNRAEICAFLPRERDLVAAALGGPDGAATRLLIVGGDCTAHAGAMAGLRAARPDARHAIAWFDAHGDFNTPDTTPSGNVWGMPFAMLCGRGDPDLVAAADGPTVMEQDAALFGGQVLDETRIADARVVAGRAVRGRDARDEGGPRRGRGLGALGGDARRMASTSPSTWTASMAPRAGR